MTRRNFNVKIRSVVLLMVLTMSLYGINNASAGYWLKVQDDTFVGYTSETSDYQSTTHAGSDSSASLACDQTTGNANLKAYSGQGFGDAYCIYDTDYGAGHNGYSGKSGKLYYAKITLDVNGVASDQNWGSYAYLRITLEFYYTNGLNDQIIGSSVTTYDSNGGGSYAQSLTMTTSAVTLSSSTQLYLRVTVRAHAEDGSWGKTSNVDFYTNTYGVFLNHWYIYEYQSSNIG